jgi:hypothetical protein
MILPIILALWLASGTFAHGRASWALGCKIMEIFEKRELALIMQPTPFLSSQQNKNEITREEPLQYFIKKKGCGGCVRIRTCILMDSATALQSLDWSIHKKQD